MEISAADCPFEDKNNTISLLNPAFYMDEYLTSLHILFAAIGIPLNLTLAGIIIFCTI